MSSTDKLYPRLEEYVLAMVREFDKIPPGRKEVLADLTGYIRSQVAGEAEAKLMFICTHNSRRSHIAQAMAQTAAYYYGIDKIQSLSGGTESTEFNRRAVEALQEAGFHIQTKSDGKNPVYEVRFAKDGRPLKMYSKRWDANENPKAGFCAIMTCSEADEACPVIPGAEKRIALPYRDPKEYDGTEHEKEAYRQRTRQIAREIFYAFSRS